MILRRDWTGARQAIIAACPANSACRGRDLPIGNAIPIYKVIDTQGSVSEESSKCLLHRFVVLNNGGWLIITFANGAHAGMELEQIGV
jgi:hypothetical protein